MKLSFSISSKQSSRPNQKPSENFNEENKTKEDDGTNHEYVTEFDASKTLSDNQQRKLVLPPKQNEWRPLKKMKNIDLPVRSATDDPDLRFELEVPSTTADTGAGVSYGLTIRRTKEDNGGDNGEIPARSVTSGDFLLQKFKEDLRNLPEDQGFDEFADVPVEGYGAALLAGYGWTEGRGIGRNAKEDVKVVQYERRAGKEGLGFVSEMVSTKKEGHNSGSQNVDPKMQNQKLARGEPKRVCAGKVVRIVGGRHVGLKAKVMERLDGDSDFPMVVLKLSRSEEEVLVGVEEIAELGSVEEDKCLKKLRDLELRGSKNDRRQDERRDSSSSHGNVQRREGSKDKKRKNDKRRGEEGRTPVSWLTSHIRVRIISKDFRGGKMYLKKGEIVDVVGPATCDISMDDSRELIQGVDQDLLETALPRRGGPVLILYGKHKGVFGNLVEKDMEKETAVIRDADSHALLNVRLEQIAEYIGDPSYVGY
ncbi:hypothetical protein HHK36_009748 [Tetracentron sinense]|uniref:G-patch domain-containing protein n=1 Tax=Tetracentron sinense TaxID=13715 RepID=A0A834ZGP2_TETSI|nr:hypothetical protein HHK36_009748 [Tetracentron sinense]